MSFKIRTFAFLLILTSKSVISQINNCYFEDTSSLIAVIEPSFQKIGEYESYTEAVYLRVPKNFVFKGENNIVEFILSNTKNEFIVNNYETLDSIGLIGIYDALPLEENKTSSRIKISIYKLKSLYIKSIPGVQFPFGDSVKYDDYPIRLEEVYVNEKAKPEKVLELKIPYIRDSITFEQIDFWEYVRDRRYIRKSYKCD